MGYVQFLIHIYFPLFNCIIDMSQYVVNESWSWWEYLLQVHFQVQ